MIRFYSQKCYIFAPNFKIRTKLQKNYCLTKLNLKIMKTYQIVALTKNGRLWESNVIYKNYEAAELLKKSLLMDCESISCVTIRELTLL